VIVRFDNVATSFLALLPAVILAIVGGTPPCALDIAAPLLRVEAPPLGRRGGPRRGARAAHLERVGEPLGEPLEAVTRGPRRAAMRAFWASLSDSDAITSNTASTREAVTLAC
jgi:hypothetical protein